jgi:hypothetical protein
MVAGFCRPGIYLLIALVLLTACAPLSVPAALPTGATSTPTPPARPTFTSQPTLTPMPVTPLAPTATLEVPPVYAEPAGCLEAGDTIQTALAYADELLGLELPLARRQLNHAWNAASSAYADTGTEALAFATSSVQNRYVVQEMLNALHVAGFTAWLRNNKQVGEHILAVHLRAGILESEWGDYVRAYWQAGALPAGDESVFDTLHLSPCRWMVEAGLAPDLPTGELEGADWSQPDFRAAGLAYLAEDSEASFGVARRIGWLDGRSESPALMCGPLAWAISADAGAYPPGYGAWDRAPKSFWLPKPRENGRPWSLFPPGSYTVQKYTAALGNFDLHEYPLATGDLVYTYSNMDGFDHLLVVGEADADGNRFAVTNLVKVGPQPEYSIQRILLYNENDPTAGYFRNQWANDRHNGRTGDGGFEIFRWAWRAKDVSGQPAVDRVRPGDSLLLVAARWKTPPALIAAANSIEASAVLQVGQVLTIPVNPP